jgi:hypothetical protein
MLSLGRRARDAVRDLSLAHKLVAVIMGVSSMALLLACFVLLAYDTTIARTSLTRDIGVLADVVGTTSTAAVSFSDAKTATETLSAVAVNRNVRMAAILRNGTVLARYDREPATLGISVLTRVTPDLVRAPRAVFTFDRDSLQLVRPIYLDHECVRRLWWSARGRSSLWRSAARSTRWRPMPRGRVWRLRASESWRPSGSLSFVYPGSSRILDRAISRSDIRPAISSACSIARRLRRWCAGTTSLSAASYPPCFWR